MLHIHTFTQTEIGQPLVCDCGRSLAEIQEDWVSSGPLSVVQRAQIREKLRTIFYFSGAKKPRDIEDVLDEALSAIGLVLGDTDGS